MHRINPSGVRLTRLYTARSEGNKEANLPVNPSFSFSYLKPFIRRNSFSFGAHGLVEVSTLPDVSDESESVGLGAEVKIHKGILRRSESPKHTYHRYYNRETLIEKGVLSESFSEEDFVLSATELMIPGLETVRLVARMAVVDSLEIYRQEHNAIADFLKGSFGHLQ